MRPLRLRPVLAASAAVAACSTTALAPDGPARTWKQTMEEVGFEYDTVHNLLAQEPPRDLQQVAAAARRAAALVRAGKAGCCNRCHDACEQVRR